MNLQSFLILAVIFILLALAILFICQNGGWEGGCAGNCAKCHKRCESRGGQTDQTKNPTK